MFLIFRVIVGFIFLLITATPSTRQYTSNDQSEEIDVDNIPARKFTFRELEAATSNFSQVNVLGEGGFGKVYRGLLPSINQVFTRLLNRCIE